MVASHAGHNEVVRVLLEDGVGKDLEDNFGDTALVGASAKVVGLLLDAGADKNVQDNDGCTA